MADTNNDALNMLEFLHNRLVHGGYTRLVVAGVDYSVLDLGDDEDERQSKLKIRAWRASQALARKVQLVLEEANA